MKKEFKNGDKELLKSSIIGTKIIRANIIINQSSFFICPPPGLGYNFHII